MFEGLYRAGKIELEIVPQGTLAERMNELDTAEEIVLQCKTGARSMRALELLHTAGFRKLTDMIGRSDVDDMEAILAIANTDVDEALHVVADNADAIFTWDYEKGARPALNKLYEKAKKSQWNGETDLPWDTEVDIEPNLSLTRRVTAPKSEVTSSKSAATIRSRQGSSRW